MSSWRVTIRTNGGDLRGVLTTDSDEHLLAVLNRFADRLDGIAVVSPMTSPAEGDDE